MTFCDRVGLDLVGMEFVPRVGLAALIVPMHLEKIALQYLNGISIIRLAMR